MSFNSQTEAQATLIGQSAAPNVGIDPVTIITIVTTLLPLLAKCFSSTPTPTGSPDPKEYLNDHYDEVTQSFDSELINRVRPQSRRAARQNGQGRLNRPQLDSISTAALEHARTADPAAVSEVLQESLAS